MKHVFLTLIIPMLSLSQIKNLQTFGTVSHFLISCPCKLLKYYKDGQLYYYCEDEKYQTKYVIKEIRHKDGLDLILNDLDKNIYSKKNKTNDSLISTQQNNIILNYLALNHNGLHTDFANYKAIIVDNELEKKLFFSDNKFIASYEIIITGKSQEIADQQFNKSINSIRKKSLGLKKIF